MAKYITTTCSAEKDNAPGLLPAIKRYQHPRIQWVYLESKRLALPMLILSGEFGLLQPLDPIPWYDHALHMDEVQDLAPRMAAKLMRLEADSLVFYAQPSSQPGWSPYHAVLEQACGTAGAQLQWVPWEG